VEAKSSADPKKYTVNVPAPAKSWNFPLDVTITDSLWQVLNKTNVGNLTIIDKPVIKSEFKDVKVTSWSGRVTFEFAVTNSTPDLNKFKIAYGDSPDSFTSESLTYSTGKIQKDWVFTWYIDKLQSKTYYFKILGVKADWSLIPDLASEVQSVAVWWALTCSIWNVGDIDISTQTDKSILSWKTVTGAISYNIYKVSASGDYTLFQNTKDTKFVLFLSSGAVIHEDFAIKALCDNKTESADYAKASKVQTGPWFLAILVVFSAILGAVIMRRRVLR
jgi:hypothetical protein